MERLFALVFATLLLICGCGSSNPVPLPLDVAIVMLGDVNIDVLTTAERSLRDNYNVVIDVRDTELPEEAFYEPRGRYRAEKLLDFLEEKYSRYDRIIALTSVDISTTNGEHEDWGIFGLGRRPGRACVVSAFRLGGDDVSGELFKDRIYKVVLHEFGHTSGLPHCENSDSCPMQDAEGKVATVDGSDSELCPSCLANANEDIS